MATIQVETLGPCPKCGKDVIEKEKLFVCAGVKNVLIDGVWVNKGCQWKVFKNAFRGLGKESLSAEEVKEILKEGFVMINAYSRSQTIYKVRLVADKKEGIKAKFRYKFKEE